MIVVAIIALLAAIAVPNLLRARHNANEGAASASLRTVATASDSFYSVQTPKRWPGYTALGAAGATPSFTELATATPPYIASKYTGANPTVQGYRYNYAMVAPAADPTNAVPMISCVPTAYHTTGTRTFAYWSYAGEVKAIDTAACPYITTEAVYTNNMTPID